MFARLVLAFHKFGAGFLVHKRLLRPFAPRNDILGTCHCDPGSGEGSNLRRLNP